MFNSIRPTNPNQILKLATGLLFILVLGVVVPNESFACHKNVPHGPHLCDGPTDPPDPTTLADCPQGFMCLASVGKWDRPAARYYAERAFPATDRSEIEGSYTKIPPNVFGNILAALSEGEFEFSDLCLAYDVLVFQWKSPPIKNLTWQSLVDYMACGGGVVFEDPSNVDALLPGVTTTNIQVHSNTTPPIKIAFDPACEDEVPTLCEVLEYQILTEFDVENNHMEFDEDQLPTPITPTKDLTLTPFLRLPGEEGPIIGLYGEHPNDNQGRIVITGPDNSFHGNWPESSIDPYRKAHHNQYILLFHEIDWVLGY